MNLHIVAHFGYLTSTYLVDGINHYATLYEEMGISDRAFLKAAVFRMLHIQCQQGNQRLISFLMSRVNPGQIP